MQRTACVGLETITYIFTLKTRNINHIGLKRFFDEGLTLSQIDHPNIVNVSNFFRANNTAYLVMRYENGKDLRWFIKNTDYVPDEEFILSVFSMTLAGLKEVHKNSFLHLDIKPSNILLRASGVPLILDLGAAYKFPSIEKHKVHTLTCLLYTSPSPRDLSTSRMPSSA